MKITNIRVTHVNVPLDAPFWWTAGLYGGASKSIVEVETDEGVVGLGEAPWWHFGEVIKAEIAPALIGADPLDLADCEARCVPPWQITANTGENAASVAFGSVELALWDIRGKVTGMPLYKLLGGAVRKDIPFSEYFAFRPSPGRGRRRNVAGGDRRLLPEDARGAWLDHLRGQADHGRPAARDPYRQDAARSARRQPRRSGSIPTCNGR